MVSYGPGITLAPCTFPGHAENVGLSIVSIVKVVEHAKYRICICDFAWLGKKFKYLYRKTVVVRATREVDRKAGFRIVLAQQVQLYESLLGNKRFVTQRTSVSARGVMDRRMRSAVL